MVDLGGIRLVDNHCHNFWRDSGPLSAQQYHSLFTEARHGGAGMAAVGTAVYYRWALKELARVFGCRALEDEVLARRAEYSLRQLTALLFAEAQIETLLIDTGFNTSDQISLHEMRDVTGCRVEWILRLETLAQDLIVESATFGEFSARLNESLTDLRGQGVVSLKSIAAYRSGLQISRPSDSDAAEAFSDARAHARLHGSLRLTSKPLIDYLVVRSMEYAATEELPIQFHTGYGDPDTDLRLGNPLHLRDLLEDSEFASVPIILLHESYPFTREAAFLAAVYPNAYLDISYSVPFLDYHELLSCTRQALGAAPWEKILYSSDGFGIPEHAWLGAIHGRQVLGAALEEKVQIGELSEQEAYDAAAAVLCLNSRRVYRL